MLSVFSFGTIALIIQLAHSIEELMTGFHKKWYLMKLSFPFFLTFEILHNIFWLSVFLIGVFPRRAWLIEFFLVLMFANGIQHIVWAGSVKKYVPGLITAILHIVNFLIFILYYWRPFDFNL